MAQTVNVNFRLEEDVKKSMEQVCADMGLSMSAAFTIFKKSAGRSVYRLRYRLTRSTRKAIWHTCGEELPPLMQGKGWSMSR